MSVTSSLANGNLKVSLALALNLSALGVGALKYFDSFDKVQLIFVHGLVNMLPLAQNIRRQILILSFSHSVLSASTFDNTRYSLNNSSSLINHRLFNRNRRTVLLTHGMYASSVLGKAGRDSESGIGVVTVWNPDLRSEQ